MQNREREPIPEEFKSLAEAGEFWDTHSAADYWDEMEDVEVEVDLQGRRFAVALDNDVYRVIERMAAAQQVSLDDFVNQFLHRELVGIDTITLE